MISVPIFLFRYFCEKKPYGREEIEPGRARVTDFFGSFYNSQAEILGLGRRVNSSSGEIQSVTSFQSGKMVNTTGKLIPTAPEGGENTENPDIQDQLQMGTEFDESEAPSSELGLQLWYQALNITDNSETRPLPKKSESPSNVSEENQLVLTPQIAEGRNDLNQKLKI